MSSHGGGTDIFLEGETSEDPEDTGSCTIPVRCAAATQGRLIMSPDEKRLRLIEAAAALLDAAPGRRLNTVSLNKGLFYLDLASLRDCGETFTQNSYVALPQGPVVAKYPDRLLKPLMSEGIAVRTVAGLANPVALVRLPEFIRLTPTVREIAERVAKWCSQKTSKGLSDYSHENPGWIIAREQEEHAGGKKQVIDMIIAMQQIVEVDPWMNSPLDDVTKSACNAADITEGHPW